MFSNAILMPDASMVLFKRFASCLITIITLALLPGLIKSTHAAETITLGSGTLDHDRNEGPRWTRLYLEPQFSGTHTVSVEWDSGADIRFSLFKVPSDNAPTLVMTSQSSNSPAVWTGELDQSSRYFLGIWSSSGKANFSASVSSSLPAVAQIEALRPFSDAADTSTWMLDGPASILDYKAGANTHAWGNALLRVGDTLLVGGDFRGIKPSKDGPVTQRPFLAALNGLTGQPTSNFTVPSQVNAVVRTLALSPDGNRVYVGGDFGLLALNATTGQLDFAVAVSLGNKPGRVFDIAVTNTQLYIGGDFTHVNNTARSNIARLTLSGSLDMDWSPVVEGGLSTGRAASVQALALSPSRQTVYVGGSFKFINSTEVDTNLPGSTVSMLSISASTGAVEPERFSPQIVEFEDKNLMVHDIVTTEFYVIIAWGGPNYLTFHTPDGTRLHQQVGVGDVQALHVVGNQLFVGHHGEHFGLLPNTIPQQAVTSLEPLTLKPYKLLSFRIDDPGFPLQQVWPINGTFGVWGVVASVDSIWIAGNITKAGSNNRPVEGLARFPVID